MKRLLPLLLILTPVLVADEEETLAAFHLKREPLVPMRGYISKIDEEGFRFRAFGPGGKRVSVKWSDVVPDDAKKMRIKFKLDLTEDEKLGLMPGHRLNFVGGGYEEGVLQRIDPADGKHWLKVRGLVLPYPRERIERVEEIKIQEQRVYDKDELYLKRLERTPPETAREHRDLADRMFDVGNFNKSRRHYEDAMALDPAMRPHLAARMAELEMLAEDEEFSKVAGKAGAAANLNGDFDKAIALLEAYIANHPDRRRTALRALDQIRLKRQVKLQQRFIYHKHQAARYIVKRHIATGKLESMSSAMSWVTSELPDLMKERIMRYTGISEQEYEHFMEDKGKGAPHHAGYWSGSFAMKDRGVNTRGKGPKADPEKWWDSFDNQTRANWLKAYMAENLPDIFEIVSVRHTDCNRCGGTGRVRKMSLTPAASGKHEWKEVCPRCFGARRDRSIAYR